MVYMKFNYNDEFVFPVYIPVDNDCDVTSMVVNKDGDVIVALSNGTEHNLGEFASEDGILYVSHIDRDEHGVFTFTISSKQENTEE